MAVFDNEWEFEQRLREIIASRVEAVDKRVRVLRHRTVGDIVIVRDGHAPAVFFLEVKYHRASSGRLGFGDGSGGGIQPEILDTRPAYLERHLRWALGSGAHDGKFWLVGSDVLSGFVAGEGIGRKQNNIRLGLFRDCPALDEAGMADGLHRWLTG